MPSVESPSVRERRLARELRLLRAAVPLHGKDVAELLGWSASKVSRIETGRIGVSPDDLDRLLSLYEVPDDQAVLLRRLAPRRPRGWWDAYADSLSAGYAQLIRLEAGSRALRCYGALVPHALLQTPEYVRQVILSTWDRPSRAEIDRRMQVCRRRQDVLETTSDDDEPMQFHAVLDESVLRRTAAAPGEDRGREVRQGQLDWLATVADRPNVTVQVLPFDAGLPPVTAGSFSVLESRATGAPDVVYLENKTRVFFIDAEAEVHRYGRAFELLSSMALDPGESSAMIRDIASQL